MPQLVKSQSELSANAVEEQKNKDLLASLVDWFKTTSDKMDAGEFRKSSDGGYERTAEASATPAMPSAPASPKPSAKDAPASSASADPTDMLSQLVAMGVQSVAKGQDIQIQQAMAEGVPSHAILSNLMESVNQVRPSVQQNGQVAPSRAPVGEQQATAYMTKPASSPFGFGGAKMENGTLVEQKPGFVGATLSALLGRPTDMAARQDMAKISGIQKVTGTEPIQPTTRYSQTADTAQAVVIEEMKRGGEWLKAGEAALKDILKPQQLSVTDRNTVNNMKEGLEAITDLENMLNENPDVLKKLSLPTDKTGQRVKMLVERAFANFVFTESGKALTDTEKKIQQGRLPATELAAYLQDSDIAREKIQVLRKGFENKLSGIDPNEMTRDQFKALNSRFGREKAIKIMQERGIF